MPEEQEYVERRHSEPKTSAREARYIHGDNTRLEREDLYNRAKKNSCKNYNPNIARVDYDGERFGIDVPKFKKFMAATLITVSIISAGLGIAISNGVSSLVEHIEENKVVHEQTDEYASIVYDNTHRTDDLQHYWYDTYDIARDVLRSEDPNLALYKVYDLIGYNRNNKLKHMDEIISHMSGIVENNPEKYEGFATYKNFNDYLIKTGCIEDGKASTDVYEERLRDYALSKRMIEKANETFTDMRGNDKVSPKGK